MFVLSFAVLFILTINFLYKIVKNNSANSCRSKKCIYLCTPNHDKNFYYECSETREGNTKL